MKRFGELWLEVRILEFYVKIYENDNLVDT